jgi:RND family efflux transporter MFP subunit
MKLKLFASIILIAIVTVLAFRFSQKKPTADDIAIKNPITVSTQTVLNSRGFEKLISYPGIFASEQQITLTAASSGTVRQINFDLGKNVSQNQKLITIDSSGNLSNLGENGLRDSQIKSLELAVQIAQENYKLAKDNYEKDDSYGNKKAKEIADINRLAAQSALQGALDGQFVIAPISGTITQKFVSLGDSVNVGQTIATISKLGTLKIQFFADKEELSYFKVGDKISIRDNGTSSEGKISKISPSADENTKRFLIEATPLENKNFSPGSVVTVESNVKYLPESSENLILPLSAITIGQNENYIFIAENNIARKVNVEIIKISGETAEIKTALSNEDVIIIDGNKLLKENEEIVIEK